MGRQAKTQVVQSASGKWFADYQGWGRKFDTEEAARAYADSFETGDDSKR